MPVWIYLVGLLWFVLMAGRSTFLLGHARGVRYYYPVVFALKSTLGCLGLLVMTACVGLAWKWRNAAGESVIPQDLRTEWRVVWVSDATFAALCLLSRFEISIRHFMVPLVLSALLPAPLPRLLGNWRKRSPRLGLALETVAGLLAISCL
jgi:hypothetical protein